MPAAARVPITPRRMPLSLLTFTSPSPPVARNIRPASFLRCHPEVAAATEGPAVGLNVAPASLPAPAILPTCRQHTPPRQRLKSSAPALHAVITSCRETLPAG